MQVIFIHNNVPGVLRKVNEILGDHNVDKQISDSKGDIAYLMADVSNVKFNEIKDLWERLELLSCESPFYSSIFIANGIADCRSCSPRLDPCALLSIAFRLFIYFYYQWVNVDARAYIDKKEEALKRAV